MKQEDLSDAMAHIGDDLIEEADAVRGSGKRRRRPWKGRAALAACTAVVLYGAVRWGGGPAEPVPGPVTATTPAAESTAPVTETGAHTETAPPAATQINWLRKNFNPAVP